MCECWFYSGPYLSGLGFSFHLQRPISRFQSIKPYLSIVSLAISFEVKACSLTKLWSFFRLFWFLLVLAQMTFFFLFFFFFTSVRVLFLFYISISVIKLGSFLNFRPICLLFYCFYNFLG